MLSDLDPKKHAKEFVSSRKRVKDAHQLGFFHNGVVEQSPNEKHLSIYFMLRIWFNAPYQKDLNIKKNISKTRRGIDLIRKVQSKLPINVLLTISNSVIRPHLDYGHIVYAY